MEKWSGTKVFCKVDPLIGVMPEIYKKFTWLNWKRMVSREKEKWVPEDKIDEQPIPKEVIDFKKKEDEYTSKLQAAMKEIEALKAQLSEPKDDREKIKAELDDLGVRYSHNSKLETLKKKLDNAVNPE